LERINKKIHYFLENLLVFLKTLLKGARFKHQDGINLLSYFWILQQIFMALRKTGLTSEENKSRNNDGLTLI
jgi:hypothetical protein